MKMILLASMLTALGSAAAHAACTPPDGAIQIPDGTIATLDEMKAAQKAVVAYNEAVSAFTACLQTEEAAKLKEGGDKKKVQMEYAKRNDDEVVKLQAVADKFNNELKAFKAKPPG
jgi:hypothetical protein